MKEKIQLNLILRISVNLLVFSMILLSLFSNVKAASSVLIPNQDISGGNYSFSNGTLTIGNGTTKVSKTIQIGVTNYNNQGVINTIKVDGELSFASSSPNYVAAQAPLNRYGGTSVNEYNGGYFGVIVSRETSTSEPIIGDGNIDIVASNSTSSNTHPLVGLVAVQGEGTKTTNVTINEVTIDATGSTVRQNYNSENVNGFVGIALGIAGNANVTLGTSEKGSGILGAPAVMIGYGFAEDDNLNGPQQTAGSANLTINNGIVSAMNIDNKNQFSAIKNFGQDTGVVNITVNDGLIDGGDYGAGIYTANAKSKITLNDGEITGYSGISVRAGNVVLPQNSRTLIRGWGEATEISAGIKVDKGNGSAIYVNTNSPSTVSYTGGTANLQLNGGYLLSNHNSAVYAQPVSGDNTSPIAQEGSVNITGGVFMSDMFAESSNQIPAVNFNGIAGANKAITGGSYMPAITNTNYLNPDSNGMMYVFTAMDSTGYGKTLQLAQSSLNQLNAYLLEQKMIDEPLSPEITMRPVENVVDSISLSPEVVNLSTVSGGTNSTTITARILPVNLSVQINWEIEPKSIATITPGSNNTATISAVSEGSAVITATAGNISTTVPVIVSNNPVIADKVSISSTSPDYYTIRVETAPNSAINATESAQQVSIFTWSNLGQTDMNAKVAEETEPGSGIFEQTFPVNDTPVNNYYDEASNIKINIYGSTIAGENGEMIFSGNYNYLSEQNWSDPIAVTTYSQDIGFTLPTVGEDTIAGTTGQSLGLEGIRLSTPIEGVQLVYDVHVENIGWMNQVSSGTYAGTMHQNLQIEAVHISLTGPNSQNYSVQYQAHVQYLGWQDWVSDGALAGTTGNNQNIEALAIQIVPNGTPLPENTR